MYGNKYMGNSCLKSKVESRDEIRRLSSEGRPSNILMQLNKQQHTHILNIQSINIKPEYPPKKKKSIVPEYCFVFFRR